jgi:hypothetical protein
MSNFQTLRTGSPYLARNNRGRLLVTNAIKLLLQATDILAELDTGVQPDGLYYDYTVTMAHAEQYMALDPTDTALSTAYAAATPNDFAALTAALQNVTGFDTLITLINSLHAEADRLNGLVDVSSGGAMELFIGLPSLPTPPIEEPL